MTGRQPHDLVFGPYGLEAPLNHPGDTRLRAQAGDGVDPRGVVAAVPTAQTDREFCHAHAGMSAWMGQHYRCNTRRNGAERYVFETGGMKECELERRSTHTIQDGLNSRVLGRND